MLRDIRLLGSPAVSLRKPSIFLAAFVVAISVGFAAESNAQVRRVGAVRSHVIVYGGFGYYPSPFWYDPWFGYGYPAFWGPWPYGGYAYPPTSDVRLDVTPKDAEVYVDGYYAGLVNDFNGVFHKLHVPPGEHEITLYMDGYRSVHEKVLLSPDKTIKLKYSMEKTAPGETQEPRPQPPNPPQGAQPGPNGPTTSGQPGYQPPRYPRGGVTARPAQPMPPPPPPNAPPNAQPPNQPSAGPASGYGTLAIRVQPGDADILIDHERWRGPAGQERLVIDLPEGRHTVEVEKSGYRTYVTEIDVRRGETTPLNVSLRSEH